MRGINQLDRELILWAMRIESRSNGEDKLKKAREMTFFKSKTIYRSKERPKVEVKPTKTKVVRITKRTTIVNGEKVSATVLSEGMAKCRNLKPLKK